MFIPQLTARRLKERKRPAGSEVDARHSLLFRRIDNAISASRPNHHLSRTERHRILLIKPDPVFLQIDY
jgi:hypothetical protein